MMDGDAATRAAKKRTRKRRRLWFALAALPVYYLSSGPVLAVAFTLREALHNDHFYAVMWLYYPLLRCPRWLLDGYISWWVVDVFGTVGPGQGRVAHRFPTARRGEPGLARSHALPAADKRRV